MRLASFAPSTTCWAHPKSMTRISGSIATHRLPLPASPLGSEAGKRLFSRKLAGFTSA